MTNTCYLAWLQFVEYTYLGCKDHPWFNLSLGIEDDEKFMHGRSDIMQTVGEQYGLINNFANTADMTIPNVEPNVF